jgi:hypothetical protein
MSSRFVKIPLYNGVIRAINMNNVITVQREGLKVIVQYNICPQDGGGFMFAGFGLYLGGSKVYHEDLTYNTEKEAQAVFGKLVGELS